MLHHYTEPTSRKQFKITNDVELNYTARVAEPVKGEANLQEEVDSTTRRGVAVDGIEDGQRGSSYGPDIDSNNRSTSTANSNQL